MLRVTLKIGAMFLKDFFEGTGVDRLMLGGFRGKIDFGYLLDEKLFFRSKLLLFEVVAKGGRSYETLDHCIHIAGVADVVKASQLIDLPFFPQLSGIEILEGVIIDYL